MTLGRILSITAAWLSCSVVLASVVTARARDRAPIGYRFPWRYVFWREFAFALFALALAVIAGLLAAGQL